MHTSQQEADKKKVESLLKKYKQNYKIAHDKFKY